MLTLTALHPDNTSTRFAATVPFFVALSVVPEVIGFVPLCFFLERPLWLGIVAAITLLVAIIYAFQLRAIEARPISLLEVIAVGVGGLFTSASMGLSLFWFYGMTWLFVSLLNFFGVDWSSDTISWYTVFIFGVFFVPATAVTIGNHLSDKLYPRTGIGNVSLYPNLAWPMLLLVVLIPAAPLVAAWISGWLSSGWFYLILQFALVAGCTPFSPQSTRPQDVPAAVEAVQRLLRASGYRLLERLQTRDTDLDRLLATFAVIAYARGNVLAFQFKIGNADAPPVAWIEGASLRSATWAVYQAAARFGITVHNVRPVMVLVGRRADDTLKAFAEKEAIHIVEIQDLEMVNDILIGKFSEEELQILAQSLLRIRRASTPQASAREQAQESGR